MTDAAAHEKKKASKGTRASLSSGSPEGLSEGISALNQNMPEDGAAVNIDLLNQAKDTKRAYIKISDTLPGFEVALLKASRTRPVTSITVYH